MLHTHTHTHTRKKSADGWEEPKVTSIKTVLLETFPVPLSQNKDSKAESNSGGLIPLTSYFPEADASFSEDFCDVPSPKIQ